jgi:hypothetical protein
MDNVRKVNYCINVPSSQTFRSFLKCVFPGDAVIKIFFWSIVILKKCGADILLEVGPGIKTRPYSVVFALAINSECSP